MNGSPLTILFWVSVTAKRYAGTSVLEKLMHLHNLMGQGVNFLMAKSLIVLIDRMQNSFKFKTTQFWKR